MRIRFWKSLGKPGSLEFQDEAEKRFWMVQILPMQKGQ